MTYIRRLVSECIDYKFESIEKIAQDFSFLNLKDIYSWFIEDLKHQRLIFVSNMKVILTKMNFFSKLQSFKEHVYILDECLKNDNYFEMFNFILKNSLQDTYLNISVAYQIFLKLSVISSMCEQIFSKLQLIKTYQRTITE